MFNYRKALARIERQLVVDNLLGKGIFQRAMSFNKHIARRERIIERGRREGYFVEVGK